MEKKATRQAYGEALLELGKKNKDIVVLDADLSCSVKSDLFAKAFPERAFNVGISEQDMISTAAGLASCGKIVFTNSFAVFTPGRCFDQIRLSVNYGNTNVKIVGSHGGILTGEDGYSHQALEDLALMRTLPKMVVVNPADATETKKAVEALVEYKGPAYLRLTRGNVPVFNKENQRFELGKGVLLKDGKDITIIATGALVYIALEATELLKQKNISARVINIHTIKPIDKELIIKAAKETKAIITAEDHSIIGGLGSAVAEVLSENYPVMIERIGVKDMFTGSGSPEELYQKHGFTKENIAAVAENLLKRVRK